MVFGVHLHFLPHTLEKKNNTEFEKPAALLCKLQQNVPGGKIKYLFFLSKLDPTFRKNLQVLRRHRLSLLPASLLKTADRAHHFSASRSTPAIRQLGERGRTSRGSKHCAAAERHQVPNLLQPWTVETSCESYNSSHSLKQTCNTTANKNPKL